jgi:catechol 2,3-dioxygenase-like lactoylglutathione lyase family enzyme
VIALLLAAAVAGLDHLPIAVRDLEKAAADYRALGFTLKPGRHHDNGMQNLHAKFSDATELELITAPEARDELSKFYVEHLRMGEGPGSFGLFAPSPDALAAQLKPRWRDLPKAKSLFSLSPGS